MTDFRALCAELVHLNEVEVDDWTRKWADVVKRTKAALAQPESQDVDPWPMPGDAEGLAEVFWGRYDQPEPQGPTDEEILALSQEHGVSYTRLNGGVIYGRPEGYDMRDDVLSFARAVLARWGRPAIEPKPQGPSETAWALAQLLDGVQRHDLPNMTGLSDSDCDRIWAARPATTEEQQ
jgi:hypothetical protein